MAPACKLCSHYAAFYIIAPACKLCLCYVATDITATACKLCLHYAAGLSSLLTLLLQFRADMTYAAAMSSGKTPDEYADHAEHSTYLSGVFPLDMAATIFMSAPSCNSNVGAKP